MVPRSFSRTTASAVAITAVTIMMNASSPGTRKRAEAMSGLYQTSGTPATGPSRAPPGTTGDTEATIWRA